MEVHLLSTHWLFGALLGRLLCRELHHWPEAECYFGMSARAFEDRPCTHVCHLEQRNLVIVIWLIRTQDNWIVQQSTWRSSTCSHRCCSWLDSRLQRSVSTMMDSKVSIISTQSTLLLAFVDTKLFGKNSWDSGSVMPSIITLLSTLLTFHVNGVSLSNVV